MHLARVVISEIQRVIRSDQVGVLVIDEETGLLKPLATWGDDIWQGKTISTGTGISGAVAASMDYTASGDTVNLAQRLESMARPGEVLISEAVYEQVKGSFPIEPLGEKAVKGKTKPVLVYQLKH